MTRPIPPDRPAGFTLIEALIALAILGFGLIGIAKFQATMVQNSGFVREQTIALRLAESKIEDLRAFQTLTTESGLPSYEAIASGSETVQHENDTSAFTLSWTVDRQSSAAGDFKEVLVNVSWVDAQGSSRSIETGGIIAGDDPRQLAHVLQSFTLPGAPVQPFDRVLRVPVPAENLGDGTSLYSPPGGDAVSITLDNVTGQVIALSGSSAIAFPETIPSDKAFYLLSGYIGFGTPPLAPPVDAESDIRLELIGNDGAPAPNHACWDDSDLDAGAKAYATYITYSCIVESQFYTDGIAGWSGVMRLKLGDTIAEPYGWGMTNATAKVCRYNLTPHPYENVTETLAGQNYIIVRGNANCPGGTQAFQPNP